MDCILAKSTERQNDNQAKEPKIVISYEKGRLKLLQRILKPLIIISETGRYLEARKKEAMIDTKYHKTDNNATAIHAFKENHSFDWTACKTTDRETCLK